MKLFRKIPKYFDGVVNTMAVIAAIIILFIMISITVDVVLRYFFNHPTKWVIEISEYLLVFLTFLIAAWVLKEDAHVKIDIVVNKFKPKVQTMIHFITSILAACACLIITWYGVVVALDHFERVVRVETPLKIPFAPLLIVIPIGTAVLAGQLIKRAIWYWKQRSSECAEKTQDISASTF